MIQVIAAGRRPAVKLSNADRKAERSLNDALAALRNQRGGYLDDDLEEPSEAADWRALGLVLAGVGIGVAAGMLLAQKRR